VTRELKPSPPSGQAISAACAAVYQDSFPPALRYFLSKPATSSISGQFRFLLSAIASFMDYFCSLLTDFAEYAME